MRETDTLSSCLASTESGVVRNCPRPVVLRNQEFDAQFDWNTIFYDVYRVGKHIVFQGPPLFNFWPLVQQSPYFAPRFKGLWPHAKRTTRNRADEIWVNDAADTVVLGGVFGTHTVTVQPNLSSLFAGRRVVHTLSKDNDIRWIIDWVRFYVTIHQADAVLLYDNLSTMYDAAELRARLTEAFPAIAIAVVSWPFRYGPQGGMAGAVEGVEAPWDSDYCQTGSLQHARFRYLLSAKSVLNVDIDELILSTKGRSIFAATEQSRSGFIKFDGVWISATTAHAVAASDCRHGDFWLQDRAERDDCPPKWCIRPDAADYHKHTWSVHNLFGSAKNNLVSAEFLYRHVKGISNNWKYSRWDSVAYDAARFAEDIPLKTALTKAGLSATLPA